MIVESAAFTAEIPTIPSKLSADRLSTINCQLSTVNYQLSTTLQILETNHGSERRQY
ncbi:MAG: hypothetical protein HC942_13180 [Microcoleus sp. SU_5_6]|nr:hypothetical protein [Microcoleus sp. SU_5_6]